MTRLEQTAAIGLAVASLALVSACGSSHAHDARTATPAAPGTPQTTDASDTTPASSDASSSADIPPELTMEVKSPVKLMPVPARYTCDGSDASLPLSWSGVPAGTAELDLFIFTLPGEVRHIPDWAIVGLSPQLHKIAAGQVPAGAIVGRNSLGQSRYSICPRKGSTAKYLVHLYALRHKIRAAQGFDPNVLRKQLLQAQTSEGLLEFSYTRR